MTTSPARRPLAALVAGLFVVAAALVGATPANAAISTPMPVAGAPESSGSFVEYNGLMYLSGVAEGDIYGTLFSFDGTTFTHIDGGPTGITNLYVYDGTLIIVAPDDLNALPYDYVLYSYDGSSFSTIASPAVSPNDFYELDGILYFLSSIADVWSIYQYDGTTVTEVPGTGGITSPRSISSFEGKLYFGGNQGVDPNYQCTLWSYDPAAPATPAAPVPGAAVSDDFCPDDLVTLGGVAYFTFDQFYSFDGVTFSPIPTTVELFGLNVIDGAIYMSGYDGTNYEPYVYAGGTITKVPGGLLTETSDYYPYAGGIYFIVFDSSTATLAVIKNGTASVVPGAPGYPGGYLEFQGKLYFRGDMPEAQPSMYVLEATADPALAATGSEPWPLGLVALALLGAGAIILVAALTRRA